MREIKNMTPIFPGQPLTPAPGDFWSRLRSLCAEEDKCPAVTARQVIGRALRVAHWCQHELNGCRPSSKAHLGAYEFAHMTQQATLTAMALLGSRLDHYACSASDEASATPVASLRRGQCIWTTLTDESLSAGDTLWPREAMKVTSARIVSHRFMWRLREYDTLCEPLAAMLAFVDLADEAFALIRFSDAHESE